MASLRLRLAALALTFAAVSSPASASPLPFFLPYPKIDTSRWYISHGWSNGPIQSCEWRREAISVHDNNLLLKISDRGGKISPTSCAEMHTQQLTGYGSYSTRMRAAKGSGLNTAFFTFVNANTGGKQHDEIDFEFLGKDTTMVQLNYYIDGKPQGATFIKLDYDASKEFHDYTFVWQADKIKWFIDDKLVHETKDGAPMPTNPGRIYVTLWSGSKQVNDWLGPFEYKEDVDAEFSWVKFTPLSK